MPPLGQVSVSQSVLQEQEHNQGQAVHCKRSHLLPGTKNLIVLGGGRWELVFINFPPPDFAETQKKYRWNLTFSPRSIPEQAKLSSKTLAPTTPFDINPSHWILWNSTGDKGAAGPVAATTAVKKKQEKKATGLGALGCLGPQSWRETGPKAPAKGRHGIKAKTVNKFDLNDDEAASLGARVPRTHPEPRRPQPSRWPQVWPTPKPQWPQPYGAAELAQNGPPRCPPKAGMASKPKPLMIFF